MKACKSCIAHAIAFGLREDMPAVMAWGVPDLDSASFGTIRPGRPNGFVARADDSAPVYVIRSACRPMRMQDGVAPVI